MLNISNYYKPETNVIDFSESSGKFKDFYFVIGLQYLIMSYKNQEISRAKITKTTHTIKSKKEFKKLVDKALDFFEGKPPITREELEELVEDIDYFIAETLNIDKLYEDSGFVQVLHQTPSDERALIKLGDVMKDRFTIRGVEENGKREYYYVNQDSNSYEPLNDILYQRLIISQFNLKLSAVACKKSLESIVCDSDIRRDIWEYANGYYEPAKKRFIPKNTLDKLILTSRQFKYPSGELIPFIDGVKLKNDNPTLWEKTLREILIPKNNPTDEELLWDFLNIISICLEQNNKWKILPIWFSPLPNTGKTILKDMNSCVFSSAYREPDASNVDDRFLMSIIDDTNLIVIDEVDEKTFNGLEPTLKRLTAGGLNNMNVRGMHSDKPRKAKGFGIFMVFTNDIPNFKEKEALLKRLFFGELPNVFIHPIKLGGGELGENEYLMNEDLSKELLEDTAGMQWYCSILPDIHQNARKPEQDEDYKLKILSTSSPLGAFIGFNYEFDENGALTTTEILEEINMNVSLSKELHPNLGQRKAQIGRVIKNVFGDNVKYKNSEGNIVYKLKRIEE